MSKNKRNDHPIPKGYGKQPVHTSEEKVYEILEKHFMSWLDLYTNHRTGAMTGRGFGPYPVWDKDILANICTIKYMYDFTNDHVKITKKGKQKTDLTEDQMWSLMFMFGEASRFSDQIIVLEKATRMKMIRKAFALLAPRTVKVLKKEGGFSKAEAMELSIYICGDPAFNIVPIINKFKPMAISEKKLIKILKDVYPEANFYRLMGAAMCSTNTNSDVVSALCNHYNKLKKVKEKRLAWLNYAECFRTKLTRNYLVSAIIEDGGRKTKKAIKHVKDVDIGYHKAFLDEKMIQTAGGQKGNRR